MIVVAVGASPLAVPSDYTVAQMVSLALAAVAYILWNLVGTRGVVALSLWEGTELAPLELRQPKCGPYLYFIIQLGLAAFICLTADHGRIPTLVWLALLPPVAFAVFILGMARHNHHLDTGHRHSGAKF